MAERANLNNNNGKGKYIWGMIMLWILSGAGIWWLSNKENPQKRESEIVVENKNTMPESLITVSPEPTIALSPTKTEATPSVKTKEEFRSEEEAFWVSYDSRRRLYQTTEASGKRFTFYSYDGNITVHTGNKWSWVYPERNFSEALLVDGEKSFVYEMETQKIIDVERGEKKYTIQCVHNDKIELKEECEEFVKNFKFI